MQINSHQLTKKHTLRPRYVVTQRTKCLVLFIHFSSSLLSCYHGYFWTTGDLLKPSPPTQIHSPGVPLHSGKMLPNDLDSSLANLVGSEYAVCLSALKIFILWFPCCVASFPLMFFFFFSQTFSLGGRQRKSELCCPTAEIEPQANYFIVRAWRCM